MDLKNVLMSERTRFGKRAVEKGFHDYALNRATALKRVDEEELRTRLREIREYSVSNLDRLKRQAIKNLRSQHINVYEAKDAKQARKIVLGLIPEKETVVKSKSNTIHEIGLLPYLKRRNKVIETDCGDFLVQVCDEQPSHPVFPSIHIPVKKMVQKIKEKHRVKLPENPEKIAHWVKLYLRKKIVEAKVGLTGANVISADGGIFILENEGNISLVTRIPEKHIIVTGIDKIVPTIQDAIMVCQACAIWGSGVPLPAYINIISSPSKTADIRKIIYGMHGAKEVYLILIDNGRSEIIKQGFEELLYCINCGACLYPCPVYRQVLDKYGLNYFGGRGIGMSVFQEGLKEAFENGLYFCTTCELCKQNCPVGIDIPELIRRLRKKSVQNNLETKVNQEMMDNIRSMGNPFGEGVEGGKILEKLFCC